MRTYIYRYTTLLFVALFALTSAKASTTVEAEKMWEEAQMAYADARFADAVAGYERVAELGYASDRLYYNLANAYFKLGQSHSATGERPFSGGERGYAVLNYQRALKLNPSMEDARYNLDLAVDHTNDTEPLPVSFIARLWQSLRSVMTANQWTALSLVMLAAVLALVLLYLLSSRIVVRKICFFSAIALALIFTLSTLMSFSARSSIVNDSRAVVICTDTTPVHASPDSASKVMRQPSQGVTVKVVRSHGDWSEIAFADGEKGWIRNSQIERL